MASEICNKCGCRQTVRSSYRAAAEQVRYLVCRRCHVRTKSIVPAAQVFRRKP
jgi:hypothetical protein